MQKIYEMQGYKMTGWMVCDTRKTTCCLLKIALPVQVCDARDDAMKGYGPVHNNLSK